MAAVVEDSTAEAADSTVAEDSTAAASGGIAVAGVELAGVAAMAGAEAGVGTAGAAGVTQAGDAAGVGVIPVGDGELASALVGAGAGVPIGEVTRMRMAIPTPIPTTPIIRTIRTMGRTRLRQRTRIRIAVATGIRVTIRSSKIPGIPRQTDRPGLTTRCRPRSS